MKRLTSALLTLLLTPALLLTGCGDDGGDDGGTITLNGAGATFPGPIYDIWTDRYDDIVEDVRINYSLRGSGAGIRSIIDKTTDFAGSDAPLNEEEIKQMGGAENIVEFPSVAGSVVMIYNLPDFEGTLNLTGELIAEIYLNKITNWNDPRIAEINPEADLPDLQISHVHRNDGSGTTFVFTNYLSTQSEDFRQTIGFGKQVQWDGGVGMSGNPGVAGRVGQSVGSIGYVEHGYASEKGMPSAAIQNQAGNFVKSTPANITAAGAGAVDQMQAPLLTADIWNQPGENAYPIAAFTYLIVYKDLNNLPNKRAAEALANFFWWAVSEGQEFPADAGYAPLAEPVREKVRDLLKTLTYKGEPLQVGPAEAEAEADAAGQS
jgi:phosphate ABC transporter phosphate-binding protein